MSKITLTWDATNEVGSVTNSKYPMTASFTVPKPDIGFEYDSLQFNNEGPSSGNFYTNLAGDEIPFNRTQINEVSSFAFRLKLSQADEDAYYAIWPLDPETGDGSGSETTEELIQRIEAETIASLEWTIQNRYYADTQLKIDQAMQDGKDEKEIELNAEFDIEREDLNNSYTLLLNEFEAYKLANPETPDPDPIAVP